VPVPPVADVEPGLDEAELDVAAVELAAVGVTLESFPDDEPHPAMASNNRLPAPTILSRDRRRGPNRKIGVIRTS
jgi:hypothetical protein